MTILKIAGNSTKYNLQAKVNSWNTLKRSPATSENDYIADFRGFYPVADRVFQG